MTHKNVQSLDFKERRPLVFMNACRTDGKAWQLTGHTSWAHTFFEAGAGAFIGTHWEVRDDSSKDFAVSFYQSLFRASTLGESLMNARKAISERVSDPTWIAYSLYGDPAGRVEIGAQLPTSA